MDRRAQYKSTSMARDPLAARRAKALAEQKTARSLSGAFAERNLMLLACQRRHEAFTLSRPGLSLDDLELSDSDEDLVDASSSNLPPVSESQSSSARPEQASASNRKLRRAKRFADKLSWAESMQELPDDLLQNWSCHLVPSGKRALVITYAAQRQRSSRG